jgi:hypothetical protein
MAESFLIVFYMAIAAAALVMIAAVIIAVGPKLLKYLRGR